MFKKIISNLPFSPSLVGKMNSYAKNLRQEVAIRRVGILFLSLTLFLNILIVLHPTQPVDNSSQSNRSDTLNAIDTNVIRTIFASNSSQGFIDTSSTIAKNSDRISYTLSANNNGTTSLDYNFMIDVSDIAEYSSITTLGGGYMTENNGSKILSWPTTKLETDSTQTRTFSIITSDSTPLTASSGQSFDCQLNTNYGNDLKFDIECPQIKKVELLIKILPYINQTVQILSISFVLFISIALYLSAKQHDDEIKIVKEDINNGTL